MLKPETRWMGSSIPDSLRLRADSPSRPLDWRWRRAETLLAPGARKLRRDDRWIVRARAFLRGLARAGGDLDDPGLARLDPDVLGARRVALGDRRRRLELQARLLARQDDERIGDRFGVAPGAVAAHESLYFHVRDRIDSSDWILFAVVGERLYTGFGPEDISVIWPWIGYTLGANVLEDWLDPGLAGRDPSLAAAIDQLIRLQANPVTPENAIEFLRLDHLRRRLDREEANRRVGPAANPVAVPIEVALPVGATIPIGSAGPVPIVDVGNGLLAARSAC